MLQPIGAEEPSFHFHAECLKCYLIIKDSLFGKLTPILSRKTFSARSFISWLELRLRLPQSYSILAPPPRPSPLICPLFPNLLRIRHVDG